VRFWQVPTGKAMGALEGDGGRVTGLAFAPDRENLATSAADVSLWDVATRQKLALLSGHTDAVADMAFSQDGRMLATGASDRTARLWTSPAAVCARS